MWDCELVYGKEPSTPLRQCDTSSFPPEVVTETGQKWLFMDEKFTTRLEDWIRWKSNSPPLARVNVLVRFGYYPWYIPFRGHKSFWLPIR
jgi:hypothetical protein